MKGSNKFAAAREVLKLPSLKGKSEKVLVKFANNFYISGTISKGKRGKHCTKKNTIILNFEIRSYLRGLVSSLPPKHINAKFLRNKLRESWFAEIEKIFQVEVDNKSISKRTSIRWMHHLGFEVGKKVKHFYTDKHEYPKQKVDREIFIKDFLKLMESSKTFGFTDEGEYENAAKPHNLPEGEDEVVFVFQDESTFYENEDYIIWVIDGKGVLRPKGKGKSLMLSLWACPCHGVMYSNKDECVGGACCSDAKGANKEEGKWKHSYQYFEAGSNRDGWWDFNDLMNQLEHDVLPIFKELHPNARGVFILDRSANHMKMHPNALNANELNLGDGGVNTPLMRDTEYFVYENGVEVRKEQKSQHSDGTQKGVKSYLEERNLWEDVLKLDCSEKSKCGEVDNCCARNLLKSQPDFQRQLRWPHLKEFLASHGMLAAWLPAFHCEFNFIERFFCWLKMKCREQCDYNFKFMKNVLTQQLADFPVILGRKYFAHCVKYMYLYQQGLTGVLLEFAIKKFTSHRRISEKV